MVRWFRANGNGFTLSPAGFEATKCVGQRTVRALVDGKECLVGGGGMTVAIDSQERLRRLERRMRVRVRDTYSRSSSGGLLYLVAWMPLLLFTELPANHPLMTLAMTIGLVLAAVLRRWTRPPSNAADEYRRWMNRYFLTAISSPILWTIVQIQVLLDGDVAPLLKCASLFGTLAFATVLAHLYTSMLRLAVTGLVVMVVPTMVVLWLDPMLQAPAAAFSLYAAYLVTAVLRSHADYTRRLDLDEALRDQRDKYEHLSRTDSLTGLCNRRTFSETLNAQVREAHWLDGAGVALALLDIDHFKSINDRHGHVIGDEVLKHLARRLESAFNGNDVLVARTGGEEFGLIFRDADEVATMIRVEAFRESLESSPVVCAGLKLSVALSIGVGSFHAERHRDDDGLYGAVDVALYAAKQQGRNRVVSVSMLQPAAKPARDESDEGLELR